MTVRPGQLTFQRRLDSHEIESASKKTYNQDTVKSTLMSWTEAITKAQNLRRQEIYDASKSNVKMERTLKKTLNEKKVHGLTEAIKADILRNSADFPGETRLKTGL